MGAMQKQGSLQKQGSWQQHEGVHSRRDNRNITEPTAEGRPATTALASAGTPIAQYESQQLLSFRGNSPKSHQNGEKFVKKDVNSTV
jgi:hypothetical protein